jgi:hypothetical protein
LGLEAREHINLFFTIMATGPPGEVPSAPEAAASMPADANEQVFMAGRRPCLIMMSTNRDDPDFDYQAAPGSRVVFVTHCPFKVSKDGDFMFLKDGVWYLAGQCPKCRDIGPSPLHCMRCSPHGMMYEPFVVHPSVEELAALGARSVAVGDDLPIRINAECDVTIRKDEKWHPNGECLNCGELGPEYYPCTRYAPDKFLYVMEDHKPDGVDIDPRKLGVLAHLLHSTLRNQPEPEAACRHFILLLESMFTTNELGLFN